MNDKAARLHAVANDYNLPVDYVEEVLAKAAVEFTARAETCAPAAELTLLQFEEFLEDELPPGHFATKAQTDMELSLRKLQKLQSKWRISEAKPLEEARRVGHIAWTCRQPYDQEIRKPLPSRPRARSRRQQPAVPKD